MKNNYRISMGISGLDSLLTPSVEEENKRAFDQGECVLVVGSPGSGKTILGLHFAMGLPWGVEGKNLEDKLEKSKRGGRHKSLWISFESPEKSLEHSVREFDNEVGFNKLLSLRKYKKNGDLKNYFFYNYIPLIGFSHDELVYAILKKIAPNENNPEGIHRLVIDCISDLEPTFSTISGFKNFLAGLIEILHKKKVTIMFLYRIPYFFGGQQTLKIESASLVDTIICLRNFDIRNQIKKGLFILKIRGREHRSELQTMDILKDKGIEVSRKGWATEGMLSGETGEIKESPIFFKLFYENKPEKKINDWLIDDFSKNRYPLHKDSFTAVLKDQIGHEFWSFKGFFGAGHANIRVLSLSDYRALPFIEGKRFFKLKDDEYLKETLDLVKTSGDDLWTKMWREPHEPGDRVNSDMKKEYNVVPNYSDLGMLCYRKSIEEKDEFKKFIKTIITDSEDNPQSYTWDKLIDGLKDLGKSEKMLGFALPHLSDIPEFIAFFMEILWSNGGDIFDDEHKVRIHDDCEEAINALKFLNDLVYKHKIAKNPYGGDFTSESIFCRKWYSGIRELRKSIYNNESTSLIKQTDIKSEKNDLKLINQIQSTVGILPLPIFRNKRSSYAAFDTRCLGILEEAASPEIGWIFIHAMISKYITKMRAEETLGLPIKTEDFKNEHIRNSDSDAYEIADKVILSEDENRPYKYKRRGEIQEFYKIENILHYEIKKLFNPLEREELSKNLRIRTDPEQNDDGEIEKLSKKLLKNIKTKIEDEVLCEKEKKT